MTVSLTVHLEPYVLSFLGVGPEISIIESSLPDHCLDIDVVEVWVDMYVRRGAVGIIEVECVAFET